MAALVIGEKSAIHHLGRSRRKSHALPGGWHMAFENVAAGRQDMGTRFPAFFGRVEASGQSYYPPFMWMKLLHSSTSFDPFETLLRTLTYKTVFYTYNVSLVCILSIYLIYIFF